MIYMHLLQQKLAKKDGSSYNRQHDIEYLWKFYLNYKRRYHVEDIHKEQLKLRESGIFSGEYALFFVMSIFSL